MQQYSSLPEQNSQVDATPKLSATIQQLHAELWLERSLNQLQNNLNDCLISTTNNQAALEAEIFQTVVNELNSALNNTKVVIAIFNSFENVGKVTYVSSSSSRQRSAHKGIIVSKRRKLQLRLEEIIAAVDLQYLENQQPPTAWRLSENSNQVIGWLIIATLPMLAGCDSIQDVGAEVITEFMVRAATQCTTVIRQVRKTQSLQQTCQQLKSYNLQLERTNQLKNQFLANTSHEIRTPLSSVIGFTHLLLAKGYDPTQERHQEYLNIIQSSGKHLLALINDILDLSKIEANQLEVQWEEVDVQTLCQNVFALVKEKAANKGLKLHLDIDPNATHLVADSLRVKQMLLNLLFNALKFTTTGTVGLKVETKGLSMSFTVWDTGTGISKDHQAGLFQPYFQIANNSVTREEGTGLGLAVTRKLAELHGGSVEVESEVAHGSRFTIVLPLTQEEEDRKHCYAGVTESSHPIKASSSPLEDSDTRSPQSSYSGRRVASTALAQPSPSLVELRRGEQEEINNDFIPLSPQTSLPSSSYIATPNSKILLLEDDSLNAQMMQTYLGKLGYQVTGVKNTEQMWKSLEHLHPAVILIDINLPDSNGLAIVRQLREHQQYRNIPVIAQTAMAMKGDRETCLAAGVNDYISKPIDLPLLATIVSKYSNKGE
ncbi:MAG: hybrid histidine kinase/response regulator HrmK [Rhizonema sp. PD37]|nr:hybrid histidine kinase/response regulator HrmK [Rhizonema sp. PD37]